MTHEKNKVKTIIVAPILNVRITTDYVRNGRITCSKYGTASDAGLLLYDIITLAYMKDTKMDSVRHSFL